MGGRKDNSSVDIESLQAIKDKVLEGKAINPDWLASTGVFGDWNTGYTFIQAVSGKLDAAAGIQDAFMPDARVEFVYPDFVQIMSVSGDWKEAKDVKLAKAWMRSFLDAWIDNATLSNQA